jgi:MFS family permease
VVLESRRSYYGWTLVVALGVVTIVAYGTTQYLFGLLVVPFSTELGWARAQVSAANSLSLVVSGVLGVWIGRLVDRYGARALMAAGSVLGAACLTGLAAVREVSQLYLFWGVGIGLAMALTLYPVTFVVVANWFHRRRGSAMALLTFIGGLSSPIYIPMSGLLIRNLGWRHALVVLALTQVCIALPAELLFIRRRPEDHGWLPDGATTATVSPATHEEGSTTREALRSPAFWTQTVANALGQLSSTALWTHLVAYLIGRGSSTVFAATVAGLIGLASLPGRVIFNILSERLAPKSLLGLAYISLAVGIAVLTLASSPLLLFVFVAVYGVGYGSINPLRATMMAEYFGRRSYGAITSVQNLAAVLGAAVGPIVAGALFDRSHSYLLALWLMGACYLAGSVAILATPRPEPLVCR